MILTEFAKFLQQYNQELIMHKTTPLELMHKCLIQIINKNPKSNVEKIIHKEIMYAENANGDYIIVGKSTSGRKLVKSLINFARSYENYNHAKWLEMTERNYHANK